MESYETKSGCVCMLGTIYYCLEIAVVNYESFDDLFLYRNHVLDNSFIVTHVNFIAAAPMVLLRGWSIRSQVSFQ